jgi:hypothetical protein
LSWFSHIPEIETTAKAGACRLLAAPRAVAARWRTSRRAGRWVAACAVVALAFGLSAAAASGAVASGRSASASASASAVTSAAPGAAPADAATSMTGGCVSPGTVLQVTGNASCPPGTGGALAGDGGTSSASVSSTVTLITGQRVRVAAPAGGPPSATLAPAAGSGQAKALSSGFVTFTWDGDAYMVPDADVPYLGSTLDPRLFDVSYLARLNDGGALPVEITYTSASALAALPASHVTPQPGGTATATITPQQAGQLGQLLASQLLASQSGRPSVPAGRLPGIAGIALAPRTGAPALPADPALPSTLASAASPGGPQVSGRGLAYYTLTLNFTDLDGKPATAIGVVQNVDNAALSGGLVEGSGQGPVTLSVPQGTYSLAFAVLTPHAGTLFGDGALVAEPQITVDSDRTVTLDARTAVRYRATVSGISAPTLRQDALNFGRTSAAGGGITDGGFNMGLLSVSGDGYTGSALLATPTAKVTKGTLGFEASTTLGALPVIGDDSQRPAYMLSFPYTGAIPPTLTFTVPSAKLTTVKDSFYALPYTLPAGDGTESPVFLADIVYSPVGIQNNLYIYPAAGTSSRTDYWYTSNPRLDVWQQQFGDGIGPGDVYAPRTIRPGQVISQVWGKFPAVPSPAAPDVYSLYYIGFDGPYSDPYPVAATVCPACRQDDNAMLYLMPYGDSDPSHHGFPLPGPAVNYGIPASTFQFYRNGTLALTSAASRFTEIDPIAFLLPLLPGAATYQINWTQSVRIFDFDGKVLWGSSADTDWAFRSSPDGPSAVLPSTEMCVPDTSGKCSFLPLLFITYDLALNHRSQAAAGKPFQIAFTVEHQQNAPAPAGVTATVSASFDGGKTWGTPRAAASLGGGKFALTIQQPALADTNGFVSLRVTARDSAGNSVTQTITNAYGLTS